jgi:predicted nucleotidyltransferase
MAPSFAVDAPHLPARVLSYLDALVETFSHGGPPLLSVVLFGSAAKGGFSQQLSDVDLILVLADGAGADELGRVHEEVMRLELAHGFRLPEVRRRSALETFIDRAGGNALSCFVCTRSDLLSGDVARVFGLNAVEAVFVDRIVLANIIVSAVTVWGEDLLPAVPVPMIRRLDVFKALFGFCNQLLLVAATYPVLPGATRHAMGSLKRSLHSNFFCYNLRPAPLEEEVAFFDERLGKSAVLEELLALRRKYRDSYGFVLRCIPAVVRLHLASARENRFPRRPGREAAGGRAREAEGERMSLAGG